MNFIKLLVSLFILISIQQNSNGQMILPSYSIRIHLSPECSDSINVEYYNEEFFIVDHSNGILFRSKKTDTIFKSINYKWYTDSFRQPPYKKGIVLKSDSIGLIDYWASEIAYFSDVGEFLERFRFKTKFGLFARYVDSWSLNFYQNQILKFPLFLPLGVYARFPLRSGKFGKKIFNYYSKRKLMGRFNYNGELENSFGYYEDIYI
ncbi:MAG: hypothetical protein HN704_02065 [Bacteroidetes bacterium]|mgnify:CR=1 FL=1|jgi:hypothetical protein|nr:hypothetical protein [Bacteroidota bacterium]MBT6685332.1 hypothetical protein [Bacteroidota bacterium]MBT7142890.1 hypothetical protein [Bacteroidota bacterium]MBT7490371.1 hypothetical protein [Bacteroidota bacterium]